GDAPNYRNALDVGGEMAFRINGEAHVWTSDTVSLLQHAVRTNDRKKFKAYTDKISEQDSGNITIRGMLDFKNAGAKVPLDEVEPASEIVKRFASGAMSFGSISME